MLLMPADFRDAYHGILDAVREDLISEERIDESVERIIRLKILKESEAGQSIEQVFN